MPRGAGVLTAIRTGSWKSHWFTFPSIDEVIIVWVELSNNSGFTFILGNIYFPPNSFFLRVVLSSINNSNLIDRNVCVVGDFNLPSISNTFDLHLEGGGVFIRHCRFFLDFNKFVYAEWCY